MVNNKKYELNSYILIISEVLKEILIGNRFIESRNEIKEIEDISNKTWELFLNFIYGTYIKNYLLYISDINIPTLNLDEVDTYDLLDLIIFADKIIALKIVRIISDYLFNKFFANNLSSIYYGTKIDSYGLYEDILSVIDPNSIYYTKNDRYLLFVYDYYRDKLVDSYGHNFNIRKLLPYPHLLYYLLVYISYAKQKSNGYIKSNIVFLHNATLDLRNIRYLNNKNKYVTHDRINDVLYFMNIKYSTHKMYQKYPHHNVTLYNIYKYILYDYIHNKKANFNSLLEENWRIRDDNLVHYMISKHYTKSSILQKSPCLGDHESSEDDNDDSDNDEDNDEDNDNEDNDNEDNDNEDNDEDNDNDDKENNKDDRDEDNDDDHFNKINEYDEDSNKDEDSNEDDYDEDDYDEDDVDSNDEDVENVDSNKEDEDSNEEDEEDVDSNEEDDEDVDSNEEEDDDEDSNEEDDEDVDSNEEDDDDIYSNEEEDEEDEDIDSNEEDDDIYSNEEEDEDIDSNEDVDSNEDNDEYSEE